VSPPGDGSCRVGSILRRRKTSDWRTSVKPRRSRLDEAEEQLRTDLRNLGALLRLSPAEAERLQLRGSLRDTAPPPSSLEALLRLALVSRPDVVAYRLGLNRAEADVKLALANRYPDLFLLYQPYTFQDDTPLERKSAHSWGLGLAVPLPVFNRNQGNIARTPG